jgi:hypothetical protein
MNEQCQHLNKQEIVKIPVFIECDIDEGITESTDCYVIERCINCGEQFINIEHYNYNKKIESINFMNLLKDDNKNNEQTK